MHPSRRGSCSKLTPRCTARSRGAVTRLSCTANRACSTRTLRAPRTAYQSSVESLTFGTDPSWGARAGKGPAPLSDLELSSPAQDRLNGGEQFAGLERFPKHEAADVPDEVVIFEI